MDFVLRLLIAIPPWFYKLVVFSSIGCLVGIFIYALYSAYRESKEKQNKVDRLAESRRTTRIRRQEYDWWNKNMYR